MSSAKTRLQKFKHAFSSPRAFHEAILLKSSSSMLINEDLSPSPPNRQTWNTLSFFAYWWSESWNVSTWSIGASLITVGASVRDALLVVFFANLLSAAVMVLNGYASSRYHIGYPVLSRSSFGIYGHYFVVVLRSILGIIWGGVQLYFEGQFISICLRCIFPSWEKTPNGIPADQFITTQTMVGFFLAFLWTIPFLLVHTSRIQHLFTVKSVVLPLAGLGIVIWATKSNGGVGSAALEIQAQASRTSTAVFAWGIVAQFNAVMGSNSALLVTIPDIARYSKTRNAQIWGQLIALPLGQTLCAAFGIISTVSLSKYYYISIYVLSLDGSNPSLAVGGGTEHVRRSVLEPIRPSQRYSQSRLHFLCPSRSFLCIGQLRIRYTRYIDRVQLYPIRGRRNLPASSISQHCQRSNFVFDCGICHRPLAHRQLCQRFPQFPQWVLHFPRPRCSHHARRLLCFAKG